MYAYKAYARQLEVFLRCPYASAALLRGGILWRLCKAFFEDRLELFLGSTGCVKKFRQATGFSPGTWGWEDTLVKEVDLTAGTHHTCIGMCNNPGNETRPFPTNSGPQPRRASMENYFLVAASFDNEVLWTGYWTASSECWFQGRLNLIRNGQCQPFGLSGWGRVIEDRVLHELSGGISQ